ETYTPATALTSSGTAQSSEIFRVRASVSRTALNSKAASKSTRQSPKPPPTNTTAESSRLCPTFVVANRKKKRGLRRQSASRSKELDYSVPPEVGLAPDRGAAVASAAVSVFSFAPHQLKSTTRPSFTRYLERATSSLLPEPKTSPLGPWMCSFGEA